MTENKPNNSFLPIFCDIRMAFVVILIAELLAIILAVARTDNTQALVFDLALYSLFIQLIALTCSASLCLSQRFLNHLPEIWIAIISYLLLLLVSFLVIELVWFFMHSWPSLRMDSISHLSYTLRCLCVTAIAAAVALHYFYIQHQWRRNIESESRARIEALQARIRPHFLFNCMNTIASLTRKEPKLAEESIENLAALFRASLQKTEHLSTLEKEFELCRQYLSIEQHRLGSRLQCDWQVSELPLSTPIPALTLQPIIENAIYHGIEPLANGGTITIHGTQQNDLIEISISNPLPQEPSENHHDGNQLAQDNVRQRLNAYYSHVDTFNITSDNQHYRVDIRIPLR